MKKFTALLVAAVVTIALSGCTIETLGEWGGFPGMKAGETSVTEKTEEPSETETAEDPQAGDETDEKAPDGTETDEDAPETGGDGSDEPEPDGTETDETGSDETGSDEAGGDGEEESAEEDPEGTDEPEEGTEETDLPSGEEVYAAFADVIAELEDQCGEGEILMPTEDGDPEMLWGVAVVRLIDMNKDGVPELYVACGEPGYVYLNRQYLYVYQDGTAVQALRAMITNDGTEIEPCTLIVDKEDAVYLGIGAPFNLDGRYVTVDLDEEELIRTDVEYQAGYMSDDDKFIYNGEELSMNAFEARQDEFLTGAEITKISYLDMTEDEMNAVLERTQETIAQIRGE